MKRVLLLIFLLSLFPAAGAVVQAQAWDMAMWPGYGSHHHHGKHHGKHYGKYCRGPVSYYWTPGYRGPACGCLYYGWPGYGPDRSAFGSTLSKGEAKKLVQWMIRCYPYLEVGDILVVEEGYEVAVVTRKGKRLIDTIFVEKDTAYAYPLHKPAED